MQNYDGWLKYISSKTKIRVHVKSDLSPMMIYLPKINKKVLRCQNNNNNNNNNHKENIFHFYFGSSHRNSTLHFKEII